MTVQFVANDVPFFKDERDQRIPRLTELMTSVDASPSEKFRRLIEAYQIEMEYGRTMSSYRQTMDDGREAEMVRLGRVALMYRTVEGGETGYWDNDSKQFVADPDSAAQIEEALSIAKEERAPTSSSCRFRLRKEAGRERRFRQSSAGSRRGAGDRVVSNGGVRCSPTAATAACAAKPAQPAAQAPAQSRPRRLRQSVQRLRDQERQLAQEREQRFRAELQRMERQAQEATQRRNAAEARSNALDRQWNENEQRIAETTSLLTERQGNLGELFGVTRQVAGDAATVLSQSLLTTQYGCRRKARSVPSSCGGWPARTALPSIVELERLWYEILREMTDSAKVVKFRAAVARLDDEATPEDESQTAEERDVVRVGPFTASSNGEYLGYLPSRKSLTELHGELISELQEIGRNLQSASPVRGYQRALVDPASGELLSLYVDRPDWWRASRKARSSAT